MSEGRDADVAILGGGTHPIGKAEEGADDTLGGFVEGEALQSSLIVQAALYEHLNQSDAQFGLALGLFLDFAGGPGHQGDVIQREGDLGRLSSAEQGMERTGWIPNMFPARCESLAVGRGDPHSHY